MCRTRWCIVRGSISKNFRSLFIGLSFFRKIARPVRHGGCSQCCRHVCVELESGSVTQFYWVVCHECDFTNKNVGSKYSVVCLRVNGDVVDFSNWSAKTSRCIWSTNVLSYSHTCHSHFGKYVDEKNFEMKVFEFCPFRTLFVTKLDASVVHLQIHTREHIGKNMRFK
jgi:hypothetical protein